MYKIKQIPEDFIVKEKIKLDFGKGDYFYYLLKKKDWNTLDAIKAIANKLNILIKNIGFAGNKDKNAITEQVISTYKTKINDIKLKDIELSYLGQGKERINLGDLSENEFVITVRNLDNKRKLKIIKIKNYFDEQRFGINKENAIIGKKLVKKEFKEACELLKLDVKNNDYINALRKYNKKMLLFYIHSYQSYIWNKVAEKSKDKKIPIIGYLSEIKDKNYIKILKEEGITSKDFLIRQFPEISVEGSERNTFVDINNFKYKYENDELNENKFKCILEFSLPKGAYGTIVVKELFG
ncbi:MAG: tRNA pseudouridine(13) synthase TruD [Candidatus Woesearchaeota archaeon]